MPEKAPGEENGDQQEIDDLRGKYEDPVIHNMRTSVRCPETQNSST